MCCILVLFLLQLEFGSEVFAYASLLRIFIKFFFKIECVYCIFIYTSLIHFDLSVTYGSRIFLPYVHTQRGQRYLLKMLSFGQRMRSALPETIRRPKVTGIVSATSILSFGHYVFFVPQSCCF